MKRRGNKHRDKAVGKLGALRGRTAEHRTVEACKFLVEIDPRFTLARAATPEEDAQGMDVVVEQVAGDPIGIQVKASHNSVSDHKFKYPDIPVIVVSKFLPDDQLLERVGGLIEWEVLQQAAEPV